MQPSSTTFRLSVFNRVCLPAMVIWIAACTNPPQYQSLPDGSQWRLLAFGEQKAKLDSAELVYLDGLVLNKTKDSIQEFYNEPFTKTDDGLWHVLEMHFSGDSLEYISVSEDMLHPKKLAKDTLTYFLRIDRMRTSQQVHDDRFIELAKLDSIIRSDSVASQYSEYKGVYIRSLFMRDTAQVREGRELLLQYRGATLSGKVFDDSKRAEGPLRFVMGNEHQVIPGIEIALEKMHRKEKMRVIIPSWLAFGARGSAGGLVPPYTTVVYDLEILQLGE